MSFNDSDELQDLALSAADAAILMFDIGCTLEDADRFSDPAKLDAKLSSKLPRHKTEI